jgi:hypothetical protein
MSEETAPPAGPRCRCGHGRGHVMVSAEPEYSGWANFWVIFMGVTATPYRLNFRCRVCKQVFDTTADPADLKKFV